MGHFDFDVLLLEDLVVVLRFKFLGKGFGVQFSLPGGTSDAEGKVVLFSLVGVDQNLVGLLDAVVLVGECGGGLIWVHDFALLHVLLLYFLERGVFGDS